MDNNSYLLSNCFDSHVHWAATGQTQQRLSLRDLKSPQDVNQLKVSSSHFRGNWLIGFGWNHNLWKDKSFPSREELDLIYADKPVAFFRCDGHALWVNSKALELCGLFESHKADPIGGKIVRDQSGKPTGILIDMAMENVEKIIPPINQNQIKEALELGMQIFNKNGITHIRDMTCDQEQWNEKAKMDRDLTLAVDQYFSSENPQNYGQAIKLALAAKKEKHQNIRAKGVKVYLDGALGSEGALISGHYKTCRHNGLQLINESQLREIMIDVWEQGLDLAIHVIGDEACDIVMNVACAVWAYKDKGILHLEHAEMVRPDTIAKMKNKRVICHMQPCHYLSDRTFLESKLDNQQKYLFPWAHLEAAGVEFDFGSDSPIEEPSISRSLLALTEAKTQGIGGISSDPKKRHEYPDKLWTPNTWTQFEMGKVKSVTFRGKQIN